jgi:phage terminase small subunit
MDELTPLQRRFCLEYIKDRIATKAYIRAGGAKKGAAANASRLIRNDNILRYIRTLIAEQESRIKVDADRVIKELCRIAFFDASILQCVSTGKIALNDLSADEKAAIAEYTRTVGEGGTTVKIKAHSKIKALDILAKHFQLFEESPDDSSLSVLLFSVIGGVLGFCLLVLLVAGVVFIRGETDR